jgi:carboxymethylenebutenolidase
MCASRRSSREETWMKDRDVASAIERHALAVQPVEIATLISTDLEGLDAGEARVSAAEGEVLAYFARPRGGARLPVLLVVHEIFGLHEHVRDLCRRLAKVGYLAIAPDLYARQGDPTRLDQVQEIIESIVDHVPYAQVMADLDAAAEWAAARGGDAARLGIVGFCWGGRISWLHAAHSQRVKAAVAWYGRLTGSRTLRWPRYPIDVVAELRCPVLGLYAGSDQEIPRETVEAMQTALVEAGQPSEIVIYPGAPHGFNADYRPSYRPELAGDAWQRMLAWLKRHGVG